MADTIAVTAPITRPAPDAIRLERVFDASPTRLWDYLTKAELRRTWFMDGDDTPGAGETFEMVVNHDNLSDDDVPYPDDYASSKGARMTETVLRSDPPRLLETTFGDGNGGIVTFELTPEGDQTRLTITHRNITSPTGAMNFGSGWNSHMIALGERIAGRGLRNFWELHARSRAAVAEKLG